MKISKQDLDKISELAKHYYRMDSINYGDNSDYVAKCWLKAVNAVLFKDINLEFEQRNMVESIDD